MQVATTSATPRKDEQDSYDELVRRTRGAITAGPLFTTDVAGLYDTFLEWLPEDRRSHYTCRACRHFVDRFGGLVVIDDSGAATSPLWSDSDPASFFAQSIRAMAKSISRARINGVFLSSDRVWGLVKNQSPKAATGEWHHLHVESKVVHRPSALVTSAQIMAERREEHGMLCRGLDDFPTELVRQAHTLLTSGALQRSEKCIGIARWLLDLHEALDGAKHGRVRENLIWRAVATAPPGFCHVRTTMISTLLEDLVAEKPFDEIKRAFDAKMHPLLYQRPQAAPTDGQLAAAEAVIAKLASAGSLARRFARLEEITPHALWIAKKAKEAPVGEGVFGHLKKKRAPEHVEVPPQTMTWDKFNWTILPDAERLELYVPQTLAPFFAFVTAEDASAPPILQWDSEDKRNPVSWYLYAGGSMASEWGLEAGAFVDVEAVTPQPSGWTGEMPHQGDGAYFILRGARDQRRSRRNKSGLALFPEILKSDYHGIRAAIEAYSKSKSMSGAEDSTACGIALQKGVAPWGYVFRVTSRGTRLSYRLDRWD